MELDERSKCSGSMRVDGLFLYVSRTISIGQSALARLSVKIRSLEQIVVDGDENNVNEQ